MQVRQIQNWRREEKRDQYHNSTALELERTVQKTKSEISAPSASFVLQLSGKLLGSRFLRDFKTVYAIFSLSVPRKADSSS